jgi:glycosyltransferase involved in cell wall biosynthesis
VLTVNANLPLVTIGLPVYNGVPHLETAIKSLLAQDYPNIEFLISDNASQDATPELCCRLIAGHPHASYRRNAENVGPYRNYFGLIERAQGQYFMWASHDDKWDPHFVTALVERLQSEPDAVLATSAVIHLREDGTLRNEAPDRPSPGQGAIDNIKILFDDHAASWMYGLYRRDWLRAHVDEWNAYPLWGFDVLWLTDVCLRFKVAGNQDAILYKRMRRSRYAPRTARAAVAFWIAMFWHLSRISLRHTHGFRQRSMMLALAWYYVYRHCIRRSNPLRTVWRVVRMVSLAAITSLPIAAVYGWRLLMRKSDPAVST